MIFLKFPAKNPRFCLGCAKTRACTNCEKKLSALRTALRIKLSGVFAGSCLSASDAQSMHEKLCIPARSMHTRFVLEPRKNRVLHKSTDTTTTATANITYKDDRFGGAGFQNRLRITLFAVIGRSTERTPCFNAEKQKTRPVQ